MESQVFIALGSNQGDRELNLLRAVAEIGKLPDSRVTAVSDIYDTDAVGGVPQGNFLNAVVRVETALPPAQLLDELMRIETDVFHRTRTVRWGPRTIDLDILFYGSLVTAGEDLVIPHPRLHERRFVLIPLSDLAPEFVHPLLHKSVTELLGTAGVNGRVVKI